MCADYSRAGGLLPSMYELGEIIFPGCRLPALVVEVMREESLTDAPNVKIPTCLVVWFELFAWLYRHETLEGTFGRVLEQVRRVAKLTASETSIHNARQRVGDKVFRGLFRKLATSLPSSATFHGLRVLAIDGSRWTIRDTDALVGEFFRAKNHLGDSGRPQFQMLALVSVYDRIIRSIRIYKKLTDEHRALFDFLDELGPTDLIEMDKGFPPQRQNSVAQRAAGGL
jgi:hypothetical protein